MHKYVYEKSLKLRQDDINPEYIIYSETMLHTEIIKNNSEQIKLEQKNIPIEFYIFFTDLSLGMRINYVTLK